MEKITDLRKVRITIHMLLIKNKLIIQNSSNDVVDFIIKQRLQYIIIIKNIIWSLLISWVDIKIYYVIICPLFFIKWCAILFTIFWTRSTFLVNLVKCIIVLKINLYQNQRSVNSTLLMIKMSKKTTIQEILLGFCDSNNMWLKESNQLNKDMFLCYFLGGFYAWFS